ncbi:murinoglobulin-2-like [Haliotis rubra]|uniref:murinoglobulin-2-like n=1 Tax=Haliotis rubra TaxID=36100 RepID=UPI001EE5A50C|nr:murinoglobulin-2-like [Haliotis rubra]
MFGALLFIIATSVLPCQGVSDGSYMLTMSRYMEVGKPQKICMTLYNQTLVDVYYTMQSGNKRYFFQIQKYRKGKGGCIDVTVPAYAAGTRNRLSISIVEPTGKFIDRSHDFVPSSPLRVTYIHSDKPIYKPGQLVRFRIMTVDSDLMPDLGKISLVRVITPTDVIMKQWRDIDNDKGIVTLEFQLAAEPLLGDWVILWRRAVIREEPRLK